MTAGDPKFNFVTRRGSASSVATFTRGSNCGIINYEKDVDNVFNKIQVLGFGSGINQVKSDVKQDATSQSAYGIREKTIVDRSIRDAATANIYCTYALAYFKDPRISLVVQVPFNRAYAIEVGDNITVVDNKLGLNGDYRVKNVERNFGVDGDYYNLQVSNKQRDFIKLLENTKTDVEDEQEFSHGDTIRQGEDFELVCGSDAGYPNESSAYVRFTSPGGGTVTINDLKANVNVTKYRVPISAGSVGSGGSSDYSLPSIDPPGGSTGNGLTSNYSMTNVSYTGEATSSEGGSSVVISEYSTSDSTTITGPAAYTTLITKDFSSSDHTSFVLCSLSFCYFEQTAATSSSYTVKFSNGSYTHLVTVMTVAGTDSTGGWVSTNYILPYDCASKTVSIAIRQSGSGDLDISYSATLEGIGTHSHTTNAQDMANATGSGNLSHNQTFDPGSVSYSTGAGNIEHDDHSWSYTDGISESALPSPISYTVYFGPTSAAPEDDELEAWQTAATNLGIISDKTKTIDISGSYTVLPNTKYTLKIKPTAELGIQVNLQSTHFNDETSL
jgi:hypothetical protein